MQNTFETLNKLFQSSPLYLDQNGNLLKNKIIEDAQNLNPDLIKILLQDENIKKTFFAKLDDILVFDKVKFSRFLDNKEFLPDSFTSYKNKIGLTANGSFLSNIHDVVLDFPYKDCILEGGQTKDDQKRAEIFYNETLAPDQVTNLLSPKCFCNAKKFDEKGSHKINKIEDDDNLIIKGNNLIALSCLLERYRGKVKCIYIDPPYNTGSDSFGYNDSFNHSTWLVFMKNRLELARKLLREDGAIFVQCDDNEQAYLKVLMDEIFGRENFVTTIHVQMSTTQGMKVKAAQDGNIVKNAEYVICFSKDGHKNIAIHPLYDLRPEYDEHYSLFLKSDGQIIQLKEMYDYRFPKDLNNEKALTLSEAYKKSDDFLNFIKTNLSSIVCTDKISGFEDINDLKNGYGKEVNRNGKKYLLTLDLNGKMRQLLKLSSSWGITDDYKSSEGLRKIRGNWWQNFYLDMGNVSKEGEVELKNGKKPERLIDQIIKMSTNPGDLVLDFHLGSGTTAAVAHKMGRQYIGIEQMDYIETVSMERLKKVIEGEQGGVSKSQNWTGGGSFVYCELAKQNAAFIDKINSCKTDKEISAVIEEILKSDFVSTKVFPSEISTEAKDFAELSFGDKKKFAIALLDKNLLYVNKSDMNDADNSLSQSDKEFTKSFYGKLN